MSRDIVIVTTASLPWMTGTAVNPALRAVALASDGHTVTLVVPWLECTHEQCRVYGKGRTFSSRAEQASQVCRWLAEQDKAGQDVELLFYDGVYSQEFSSILPVGDLTSLLARNRRLDVVILEEPEHLTWHHVGRAWTDCAELVVGVCHTNYLEYVLQHDALGPVRAAFVFMLNVWVCAAHCHRVIRLSAAVQRLPGAVTENVHGVRKRFLDISASQAEKKHQFSKGAYFLGKVLWTKGYRELFGLLEEMQAVGFEPPTLNLYGSGPDIESVQERVKSSAALKKVRIHAKVVDHASEEIQEYQVFVNVSQSDVVCTATAEALAMGKNVVLLLHASNEFFVRFRNARFYENAMDFSRALFDALTQAPHRLGERERRELSWASATQRFYSAVSVEAAPHHWPWVSSALAAAHRASCQAYEKVVPTPALKAVRARYEQQLIERGGGRMGKSEVSKVGA